MPSTFSLLGTIKCSTCGVDVDIAELGDHVCAPQTSKASEKAPEPEPVFPLQKAASTSQETSRQAKHGLPPIDPDAANRSFFGQDQPTPRSSSSGSQEISPATPADGHPLKPSFENAVDSSKPKESASSSVYTDTPSDTGISPQHLYIPPPNDSLYAPVSPIATGGRSLMEKLSSIAPGPFALSAFSPGDRPCSREKPAVNDYSPVSGGLDSPEESKQSEELKKEIEERERFREEAQRKLSAASITQKEEAESLQNSIGDKRPPTSSSNRSTRSKRSESSSSASSSKSRASNLRLVALQKSPTAEGKEVEKPLPSPSYQAYRPPQPPQRLPRSPTFPDRPKTPAGPPYGTRLQNPRQPIGLPPSPAHNRQKSNTSNLNSPQPQLHPTAGMRRPPMDPSQRSPGGLEDRSLPPNLAVGQDRLAPNMRDRSRSRPGTRDGDRDELHSHSLVGSPYHNNRSPLSASRTFSSSTTSSSFSSTSTTRRAGSTSTRTTSPRSPVTKIPPSPLPPPPPLKPRAPHPHAQSSTGHEPRKPSSGSINLADIDNLMKDLQDSMRDFSHPPPVREDYGGPIAPPPSQALPQPPRSPRMPPPHGPLQFQRPTTPNANTNTSSKPSNTAVTPTQTGPQSRKDLSPKKSVAKSNCRGCGEAIQGKGLTSSDGRLTGRYHKGCFVCQTCREPFETSTFYVWDNLPYCARHYHKLNNSLCGMCDNGIEGPCLETERKERFHPECFTCVDCRKVLGEDYFEFNGKPYCETHAYRMIQQQRSRLGPGRPMGKMERRRTRMMMM
ncbi:hypothetical protein BDZ91DRAFT_793655 [Kalaharituber pfeilii]|nr:hypothetical protein BDZ91DRAFT_793655 [Kalaharituber pfeilii]